MRACRIIDGAAFGPDALKVIGRAFDAAWDEIAGHFAGDPATIAQGRVRLAEAVLSVASEDSSDVEALKRGALEAMALHYKSRSTQPMFEASGLTAGHMLGETTGPTAGIPVR